MDVITTSNQPLTKGKESMSSRSHRHYASAGPVQRRFIRAASRSSFLLVVILTLSVLVAGSAWAAATTHWVDAAAASTPPGTGCGTSAGYITIQDAINAASPGDTIRVCAGTYLELAAGPLTINKTLTLLGAQNGVDARSRVGAESIVADLQGTSVSASGVIIDGFTFQNSTAAAFTGYGLWLNPGVSGTRILNNIIQDNIIGIGLANSGPSQAVIRRNLIQNNTRPGPASGSGIYTDEFAGGATVRNVLIEENAFIGHAGFGAAINISNTSAAGGVFDLEVSANLFDMNSRAFVLFNTHTSSIHDNTIANNTFVASAAIRIFDNNTQLSIFNNDLVSGVAHAIRLSFLGAVGVASSGVVINENNIGVAGSASFTLTGLTVDPLSHVGTVNAECNWWGSSTGPTDLISNPGGTGEEVVGDADYTPWLTAPTPVGACIGGASTPGKVTGGGQIPGSDPIFSPLGDLLSIPALMPSLADPNGKATFGFVVRCCPATGNLEYNDHETDVRIKAQSIDALVISNGGCGPNTHATFTGTASVIRSTGTTTEPFTVEVDDCSEPGTADTFSIKTTTYSNGPSTLIGGNIQIHR
jgi:parallel beta helix pectate lyase-like protein